MHRKSKYSNEYNLNGYTFLLSQKLTDEQDLLFKGSAKGRTDFSVKLREIGKPFNLLCKVRLTDCDYLPGKGLIYKGLSVRKRKFNGVEYTPDDWKKILPEEVLTFKKPIYIWLRENSLPQSVISLFFNESKSFVEWYDSEEYRKASGEFNAKSGIKVRQKNTEDSIIGRLNSLNLTLLEHFNGVFDSERNLRLYRIKCNTCGYVYESRLPQIRICPKCKNSEFRSKREILLTTYLNSLGKNVLTNYRGMSKFELDLYLPDDKIAFEFNGYYWHRSGKGGKYKEYHRWKTEECLKRGIKLYHLWEDLKDSEVLDFVRFIISGFDINDLNFRDLIIKDTGNYLIVNRDYFPDCVDVLSNLIDYEYLVKYYCIYQFEFEGKVFKGSTVLNERFSDESLQNYAKCNRLNVDNYDEIMRNIGAIPVYNSGLIKFKK